VSEYPARASDETDQAFLRQLLQRHAPEAALLDANLQIISRTEGAARFLRGGNLPERADLREWIAEDLREAFCRALDRSRRLNRRFAGRESPLVVDGMTRYVRVAVEPVPAATSLSDRESALGGSRGRWLVTWEDATEATLVRRGLERENARLAQAMQASDMGVFDWNVDSDRLIANDVLCRLVGVREGSLVRGEQFFQRMHPGDAARVRREVIQAFQTESDYQTEFRIIADRDSPNPGSSNCDGPVWLAARGQPLTDANGERRLVGVNWDVTPRRVLEQSLARTRREVEVAMAAGRLGAWRWDIPTDSVWWSDSMYNVLGYRTGEFQGTLETFSQLLHPDDQINLGGEIEKLLQGQSDEFHIECRVRHRSGKWLWIIGDGAIQRDDFGEPVTLIGAVRDVTSQKEAELRIDEARRQAEAANESKSVFLANMSHEIRTPMTAILGYTDLAQSTPDSDELEEHLQTIRRNGYYLLEIINDILDLSKIEAGKIETSKHDFEPLSLVADVHSIMHVRARENDLELRVQYEGELPETVRSDPKRLKQILINLVGNAIKFTRRGHVLIRVRYINQGDGFIEFDVIDTGIGIAPQQQQTLFEPFMQGNTRIDRDYGGTGLGLAISQRLARSLDGDISVESTVGRGSRFTCRVAAATRPGVPMIQPQRQTQLESVAEATDRIRLDQRILVVDDRRDIRFLSRRILSGAGASIVEAADGLEAIGKVNAAADQQQPFDCIVLDMQMPRLDGYRTAERLRKLGFDRPILALTAEAMDGDSNRCLTSGCDDYMSKPINAAKLLKTVARLTAQA
jgi:PAS domain S-box-containing protein